MARLKAISFENKSFKKYYISWFYLFKGAGEAFAVHIGGGGGGVAGLGPEK